MTSVAKIGNFRFPPASPATAGNSLVHEGGSRKSGDEDWRVGCVDESVGGSVGVLVEAFLEGDASYCTSCSLKSTGSLLYELLPKARGLPESEVRCELRAHRRVSLGRGF